MSSTFANKRSVRILLLIAFLSGLTACTSLLIGNRAQSLLLKTFLTPLIGFDPTEVKLLENPMIKNRLEPLLGDKYEPTMKLLNTAQAIQRDGALFYIASKYAPSEVQAITDKAAMVWNADTNQMAVMLIKDNVPEIISEQPSTGDVIKPLLPKELQNAFDSAKAYQEALKDSASNTLLEKTDSLLNNKLSSQQ